MLLLKYLNPKRRPEQFGKIEKERFHLFAESNPRQHFKF